MNIRKATNEDIPQITELYELAKEAMAKAGIDQWQDGYPNAESARADIENGFGFVAEENGRIVSTACLAFGHEPTYDVIVQGGWKSDAKFYGFLHRIAVAPETKGRGIAVSMFAQLERRARERGVSVIRGDTHRDNLPMQRVMEKSGLCYRGIIYLENGDERMAYEKLL